MAIAGIAFVTTAAAGFGIFWALNRQPDAKPVASHTVAQPTATATPAPTPTPLPAVYALTGLPATAEAAAQPVTGVIVENLYPDARPQSGLSSAGLVYEALAEGGITRMLALFQAPYPASIGPVRSLRPYYLDWGLEHNVPVAHAGGSEPAMAAIKPLGMKDINALAYDGSYFKRIAGRVAPHNLYTTNDLLSQLVAKLGFAQAPAFKLWERKADAPSAAPSHTIITIPFSTAAYKARYDYHGDTNSYFRFEGGAAQTDKNTGKQIEVKNVIVQFHSISYGTQSNGKEDVRYGMTGTGKILVFLDGNVITGTWKKASDGAQTEYVDNAGLPIKFNRGNTWISAVPADRNVTY